MGRLTNSIIETTESSTKPSGKHKTFRIPVSNGIFEHYPVLKDSIWLLLWYIDRTTQGEGR